MSAPRPQIEVLEEISAKLGGPIAAGPAELRVAEFAPNPQIAELIEAVKSLTHALERDALVHRPASEFDTALDAGAPAGKKAKAGK